MLRNPSLSYTGGTRSIYFFFYWIKKKNKKMNSPRGFSPLLYLHPGRRKRFPHQWVYCQIGIMMKGINTKKKSFDSSSSSSDRRMDREWRITLITPLFHSREFLFIYNMYEHIILCMFLFAWFVYIRAVSFLIYIYRARHCVDVYCGWTAVHHHPPCVHTENEKEKEKTERWETQTSAAGAD